MSQVIDYVGSPSNWATNQTGIAQLTGLSALDASRLWYASSANGAVDTVLGTSKFHVPDVRGNGRVLYQASSQTGFVLKEPPRVGSGGRSTIRFRPDRSGEVPTVAGDPTLRLATLAGSTFTNADILPSGTGSKSFAFYGSVRALGNASSASASPGVAQGNVMLLGNTSTTGSTRVFASMFGTTLRFSVGSAGAAPTMDATLPFSVLGQQILIGLYRIEDTLRLRYRIPGYAWVELNSVAGAATATGLLTPVVFGNTQQSSGYSPAATWGDMLFFVGEPTTSERDVMEAYLSLANGMSA